MSAEERAEERRSSMKRRAETHNSGFDRTAVQMPEGWKPFQLKEEGVKRISILNYRVGKGNPYADEGMLHPERTFYTHRDIGPNDDVYICLAKTFNEKCPVCEWRANAARNGEDPKLIKALEPKQRQLWIVWDYSQEAAGFMLWDSSFHQFGKLLDKRIREADADEPFDMFGKHRGGFLLKLGVTEKILPTGKWPEVTTIDFKARTPEQDFPKGTLEKLPCLDDLIIKTPYDKLKRIFLQIPEGVEIDEDAAPPAKKPKGKDDEKPAKANKKPPVDDDDEPAPKKKPPVDDDDEPAPKKKPPADDDEPAPKKKPVADDDDEPKPKKAPKEEEPAPKKKPADDDDWDDWEDEKKPAKAADKKAKPAADDDE